MQNVEELRSRLTMLGEKISATEERLKLKHIFNKDHQATADELKARHAALTRKLDEEIAVLEEHGHHVDSLEKTILIWLEQF